MDARCSDSSLVAAEAMKTVFIDNLVVDKGCVLITEANGRHSLRQRLSPTQMYVLIVKEETKELILVKPTYFVPFTAVSVHALLWDFLFSRLIIEIVINSFGCRLKQLSLI